MRVDLRSLAPLAPFFLAAHSSPTPRRTMSLADLVNTSHNTQPTLSTSFSPPSPPRPTAASLPPEILAQIFEEAAPYSTEQVDLALVIQAWSLATTIGLAYFVQGEAQALRLADSLSSNDRGAAVQDLVIEYDDNEHRVEELLSLLRTCTRVHHLCLMPHCSPTVDGALFSSKIRQALLVLTDVRRLSIQPIGDHVIHREALDQSVHGGTFG